MATKPTGGGWHPLDKEHRIALFTFILAAISFGWQVYNALIGSDVKFLDMVERTVELRCSLYDVDECWMKNRSGNFAIVLPVFFSNTGAVGYNAVVHRVEAGIRISRGRTVSLVANQVWQVVQGGSSEDNRPFVPFMIEGRNVNGAELRFAQFEKPYFKWSDLVAEIIDKRITNLEIQVSASVIGNDLRPTKCRFTITDDLRKTIEKRRKDRSNEVYLSAPCQISRD